MFFLLSCIVLGTFGAPAHALGTGIGGLNADITEYKAPADVKLSPFLAYDGHRNAVWSGDIASNGSKMVEFSLSSHKYAEYPLSGRAVATHISLDSKGNIWYIDSFDSILGHYYPENGSNKMYQVPGSSELLGMALDRSDNPWIISPNSNHVFEFDPAKEQFLEVDLPANSNTPFAITLDTTTGKIWVAEFMEKMISIEPQSKKVTLYHPDKISYGYPVSVISDPSSGRIYFSEHDLYDVKALDTKSEDLHGYSVDFGGYPTGLAFDQYGNLWVSQHTLDKVAVIDTSTGQIRQFDIPKGSLAQWLTEGPGGEILFLDYGSNAIGTITASSADQVPHGVQEIPVLGRLFEAVARLFSGLSSSYR